MKNLIVTTAVALMLLPAPGFTATTEETAQWVNNIINITTCGAWSKERKRYEELNTYYALKLKDEAGWTYEQFQAQVGPRMMQQLGRGISDPTYQRQICQLVDAIK